MPDVLTTPRLIVVLVDRSGSMASCRTDTEGGLATFIADQADTFPHTMVALHQFDNMYETVYTPTPIADVPAYTLRPRGNTALLDAIGRTITDTKAAIKPLPKEQRPEVIVVILTDGHENASTEYTLDQIKTMTEKRQAKGWTFVYLGANQDAITVAASMGIRTDGAMTYDTSNTADVMASVSGMVSRGTTSGIYGFSDDERTSAVQ